MLLQPLSAIAKGYTADQGQLVPAMLQILDTAHRRHLAQCTVSRKRKQGDEELQGYDKLEAEELEHDLRFGHRVRSFCLCHVTPPAGIKPVLQLICNSTEGVSSSA